MHRGTPLNPAKTQRISWHWPVFRHLPADNQRKTKRVESCLVRCLDGGSSPPISTGKTDNQSIIGISTILNALFGVVFILLYQSVLNWCVIPVLFQRNSPPFKGKGESPNGVTPPTFHLSPDNLVHPPTSEQATLSLLYNTSSEYLHGGHRTTNTLFWDGAGIQ